MLLRPIRAWGLTLGSMRLGIKGGLTIWEAEIARNGALSGWQSATWEAVGRKGLVV
jgi:hypothetical protein